MNYKTLLLASAIMALAGFTTGCGNACDDAADKFEECGFEVNEEAADEECDEAAECASECITSASCDEIKSTDLQNSYYQCLGKCAQ